MTTTIQSRVIEPIVGSASADAKVRTLRQISVLVPVRNEEHGIRAILDELCAQDYPCDRYEVLVVDGCSTDRTSAIVVEYGTRHPNIRLLLNPRRLASSARNIGIRAATGELVVVIDGHCQLHNRQYLQQLNGLFGSDVWCVGRPQPLEASEPTLFQEAVRLARSSRLGHHPSSFIYADGERIVPASSVAIAYRRHLFSCLGFFDEHFDACEDVEFNHRVDLAGLPCRFSSTIGAAYSPRSTVPALVRQLFRYGSGRVRLGMKHPDTWQLVGSLPGLLLTLTLTLGMLAGISWGLGMGLIGVVFAYVLLLSVVGWRIAGSEGRPGLFRHLVLAFASIHGGLGVGQTVETVRW